MRHSFVSRACQTVALLLLVVIVALCYGCANAVDKAYIAADRQTYTAVSGRAAASQPASTDVLRSWERRLLQAEQSQRNGR